MAHDAEQILADEAAAWRPIETALAAMDEERFTTVGVTPIWSPRDVAHHLAYWMDDATVILGQMAFSTWHRTPDDRGEIEAINLREGERSKGMSSEVVRAELLGARDRLRAAFAALPQVDDDALEWFDESASRHYEEHEALIEWAGRESNPRHED